MVPQLTGGLTPRRRWWGLGVAVLGLPLLTAVLKLLGDALDLSSELLLYLGFVVVVALVGGGYPAVLAAVAGTMLANYFFTPPVRTFSIAEFDNLVALAVFVLVALAVAAVVEISARRAREASRAAELAEGNRMRTALLAAVSHDLRTPLASIKASISALRMTSVALEADDVDELHATIDESADQLTALIDNLLDMSRLQTGAVNPLRRPVTLDEVVPRAVADAERTFPAITVDVPETLPAVVADPGLLERALANLVSNAVRHGGGAPVLVRGSVRGDRVELRVVDTGPGVPKADRDRIFAPFQRLGDRPVGNGVGLGLAVARGFVEAMGGTLQAADTPGGGLTMVISLEVAR